MGLITLVAALLRFWDLPDMQFRADEAQATSQVRQIIDGHFPTEGGGSSVGISKGPAAPYILRAAAIFSPAPLVLQTWISAINVAAIPLFSLLIRSLFGSRAALLAAALVAVNPWLIVTSRRLWRDSLLPPAAIFLLWSLHSATESNRLRAWAFTGVALSTSLQIHLTAIPNALAMVGIIPAIRAFSWRGPAVATVVAGALAMPWLTHSLWDDLLGFNLRGAVEHSLGISGDALRRAALTMSGSAYQEIAHQTARILDATLLPIVLADIVAVSLAVAGWVYLIWLGWAQRRRAPAVSATCLVAAAMVAIPIAAVVWRPPIGALPYPSPPHFINIVAPLVLGMGGLAEALNRRRSHVGTIACSVVVTAQLAVAIPFFATINEYWPEADYGIPWRFTDALVGASQSRALATTGAIWVGGDAASEHHLITTELLRREYALMRAHDGRDGIVFMDDAPSLILVTTDDGHSGTRFLRREFPSAQFFEQRLPGFGWTRRAFELTPATLQTWAAGRLQLVTSPSANSALLRYERAALLPAAGFGEPPVLALQWRFQSEPIEAFFTDIVLSQDGNQILKEPHLAYPAPYLEPEDWKSLRMLNLFQLPQTVDVNAVTEVSLVHNGLRSGQNIAPLASLGELPWSN